MIDKNKKTIIFDFGNVFIDLDYPKCFAQFLDVLKVDFSEGLSDKTKAHLFKYERGKINTEGFLWHLQQYNPSAEIREVIAAWNSLLSPLPIARFEMLPTLRDRYNIVMLSNINDMHIEHIHRDLKNRLAIDDFHEQYFDKVYYSCRIGMRKPDSEIYEYVQNDLGVVANDILFIDDMASNIEACKNAGWHGIVHDPSNDIIDKIEGYLEQSFGIS